jgi:hypothetical protein
MYVTNARHFLDEKGAIAPVRGAAKAMVEFHAATIAYATDYDDSGVAAPRLLQVQEGCGQGDSRTR